VKRFFTIPAVLLFSYSYAQTPPPVTQQLENLASRNEEELQEDDSYLQELEYYKKHPVNLNGATAEDLQALHFLTDIQVINFIRYRHIAGKLIDVYELQAIPGWDLNTINKITPFIFIGPAVTAKENFLSRFHGEQSLLLRVSEVLEKAKGYDKNVSTHYLGDRSHLLFRYRYQYKELLQYGVLGEKDAGEQFFKGSQSQGFDFYSAHFFIRKLGTVKALALGDYTVNLGQGLIQWQSLAFGKSAEVTSIKRQSPVLQPYRSAGEFYFNRGAAITLQKRNIEGTFFASYKKPGANSLVDSIERISSLVTSGLYRTASEIDNKNKVRLFSAGGTISYQTTFFKVGLNTVMHRFDRALQKQDAPYNYFTFSGKQLVNSSMDYSYTFKNLHLFGEAAIDKNLHHAFLQGMLFSADPKIDIAILYRTIQKEYQVLFADAFTESSLPVNEKGVYIGVTARPHSSWQVSAYADFYQFPWLRYRVNAPSRGYDYLVQVTYRPDKRTELYVRFKNENKPLDGKSYAVSPYPADRAKQQLRLHVSDQLTPGFLLKSRLELLWFNKNTGEREDGFLGYVDGTYGRNKFSANVRVQYFETDSYSSRIYVYENDVLYNFSIPAFYDKGFRCFANLNYAFSKRVSAWLRWSSTLYNETQAIGSGLEEIYGKNRSEVRAQVIVEL
jgi:hypothetical protein